MLTSIKNYDIKNDSTFKIGGIVNEVFMPTTIQELTEILKNEEFDFVLGNCSNLLFSSNKINKKIILTKKINEFSIQENIVKVSCGTNGGLVSKNCLEKSLTGFEFLIGFPGSFGGMIYMNASAHGQAISDTIVEAKIYDLEKKEIRTLNKKELNFEYRNSVLMNKKLILLEATFKLKKSSKIEIEEKMNSNLKFRKEKQPSLKYPNAGSIFKNPKNDSAGRLIESCNFKGKKVGGAKVFENHANFIINENNATSKDVLELMLEIKETVKAKFDIELYPEVKYIGDSETEEYKIWELIS